MNRWLSLALVFGALSLAPLAKASEWNKRTIVTFNQPVEIPGRVLGPGTYVMKLADNSSDRDIVQFFNKNGTRLVDTVMGITDYRLEPTGKTVIGFEERAANSPEAVKDWFYPGDLYGVEFVYPHEQPVAVAHNTMLTKPEPAYEATPEATNEAPAAPAPAPVAEAPAPAPQPQQEVATATPEPAPIPEPAPAPQEKPAAKELPKTGSELPLTASLGGMTLLAGIVLRKRTA